MDRPFERLEFRVQDGVFVVKLTNYKLQAEGLEQLSDEWGRLIDESGCRKMVLSLGATDLMCIYSVLLANVIGLQQRLTSVGGTLALAELSDNTRDVFRATGLDSHFKFFADAPSAVRAIA